MRESATQKLSHAYHLDEIAASVATMQSASTLEDVARLVLQRNDQDADAKYVHFFHEKIPSRQLAESTNLQALDDVVGQKPMEAAPLRTRAVTRIFKDDHLGAAQDLTTALHVNAIYNDQRKDRNTQMDLVTAREAANMMREYRADAAVAEKEHPSSLEQQALFHRAGAYLTLACNHIASALEDIRHERSVSSSGLKSSEDVSKTPAEQEATLQRLEAQKLVRTYAKRARRDYLAFLAHFDYTPGLPREVTEAFLARINQLSNGRSQRAQHTGRLLEDAFPDSHFTNGDSTSTALVKHRSNGYTNHNDDDFPTLPPTKVYPLNTLFAELPPSDLPAYPLEISSALIPIKNVARPPPTQHSTTNESLTYHPLLPDALHSLLLTHTLLPTSITELKRHAYMVARLARIADGYPIFLAARSPARADWVEVLRRARNWLGLQEKWDVLCKPVDLPGSQGSKRRANGSGVEDEMLEAYQPAMMTEEQKREKRNKEAVREALADERVVDEESFKRSVRARELRAAREEEDEQRREYLRINTATTKSSTISDTRTTTDDPSTSIPSQSQLPNAKKQDPPKKWTSQDGEKDYPISTERADAIACWILCAPTNIPSESRPKKKKPSAKRNGAGRLRKEGSTVSLDSSTAGLERSVDSLQIDE